MYEESAILKFMNSIAHTTDGPVTAFVLIARTINAVKAGADPDVAKNGLYEALITRGSLVPTDECHVCGGVDEGNTCCPTTVLSFNTADGEPACPHDLVEVLSTNGRNLDNAARQCARCGAPAPELVGENFDEPKTALIPKISMHETIYGSR